ncbi:MAG TPA: hypothetical protein PKA95_14385 [Thermomicrobiales bacterium]|nr:hypothetical protein [Thermomicrobiales bacterium]
MWHRLCIFSLLLATIIAVPVASADESDESNDTDPFFEGRKEGLTLARNTVLANSGVAIIPEDIAIEKARDKAAALAADGYAIQSAWADGRVYDVFDGPVNIRACAGTGCTVLAVAGTGADLLNDASGGRVYANGYYWVRVVYGFTSSDPCVNGTQMKGWVAVDFLNAGTPHVIDGPLNVRLGPSCSSTVVASVWSVSFYQNDNQWSNKWYRVVNPTCGYSCNEAYVQGWDYIDVY